MPGIQFKSVDGKTVTQPDTSGITVIRDNDDRLSSGSMILASGKIIPLGADILPEIEKWALGNITPTIPDDLRRFLGDLIFGHKIDHNESIRLRDFLKRYQ